MLGFGRAPLGRPSGPDKGSFAEMTSRAKWLSPPVPKSATDCQAAGPSTEEALSVLLVRGEVPVPCLDEFLEVAGQHQFLDHPPDWTERAANSIRSTINVPSGSGHRSARPAR